MNDAIEQATGYTGPAAGLQERADAFRAQQLVRDGNVGAVGYTAGVPLTTAGPVQAEAIAECTRDVIADSLSYLRDCHQLLDLLADQGTPQEDDPRGYGVVAGALAMRRDVERLRNRLAELRATLGVL